MQSPGLPRPPVVDSHHRAKTPIDAMLAQRRWPLGNLCCRLWRATQRQSSYRAVGDHAGACRGGDGITRYPAGHTTEPMLSSVDFRRRTSDHQATLLVQLCSLAAALSAATCCPSAVRSARR